MLRFLHLVCQGSRFEWKNVKKFQIKKKKKKKKTSGKKLDRGQTDHFWVKKKKYCGITEFPLPDVGVKYLKKKNTQVTVSGFEQREFTVHELTVKVPFQDPHCWLVHCLAWDSEAHEAGAFAVVDWYRVRVSVPPFTTVGFVHPYEIWLNDNCSFEFKEFGKLVAKIVFFSFRIFTTKTWT